MVAGPQLAALADDIPIFGTVNPLLSIAWLAEEDGCIIGHIILHSVPIVESLKVAAGHSEESIARTLIGKVEGFLLKSGVKHTLCRTKHPALVALAQRKGFEEAADLKTLEWTRK
jgi:hypothetical protein